MLSSILTGGGCPTTCWARSCGGRAAGFAGVNVTHPFKQSVITALPDLSAEAAAIGAVNTVVFENGRSTGHNTDCWGFAESFRERMARSLLDSVLLFGAGGGGAAVAHALLGLGVGRLVFFDIHEPVEQWREDWPSGLARVITPVTELQPALSLVLPASSIRRLSAWISIPACHFPPTGWSRGIGWPISSIFRRKPSCCGWPARFGCRTIAGAGMAVFQAVKAFELFTGVAPDRTAMTRHFEAAA